MVGGALAARPRLRADLTIVRRETPHGVDYIVKEPTEGKYSRFGEAEIELMQLMDGERTPEEIAEAAERKLGFVVGAGSIADFAQKLKRLGLVERTPAEQHLMLLERLRATRRRRARRRSRGSILRIRFSAGDPDRLFTRWERYLRWMWTPLFAWACAGLFVAYVVILVTRWPEFFAGLANFYTASNISAWDYLLAYGLLLSIIVIHELGHGLTTKHFGGEVHEIGGMFLYFMPALYCNTNDAWLFPRRSHRLWVTFAGPWIQLLIASVASIVWLFTEPGTFAFRVAFLAIVLGGMASVVTNLNPLIPLDGYYALSDYLEIPNLRRRAFDHCRVVFGRRFLGIETGESEVTPRERRVFLIYGSLAFFYSILAVVLALVWFITVFQRLLGPWIWLVLVLLVGRIAWPRLVRLRAVAGSVASTAMARWRGSRRPTRAVAAGALGAVVLALFPWTHRADGPLRIEASRQRTIVAAVAGVVERVFVLEGDTVVVGQPLLRLWNPELEARVLDAGRRVAILDARRAEAEARGDLAAASSATAALAEAAEELELLEAREGRLVVRAPMTGIVLGHELDERVGEALAEGDSLLALASLSGRVARVRVPLREAGELALGQTARLKISTWPGHTFTASVTAIAPAARDGAIEAWVPLPEGPHMPAPGMVGVAKIATGRGTVGTALGRTLRRMVRLDVLL
jgi:putative peptide zinc metalloprotease protein